MSCFSRFKVKCGACGEEYTATKHSLHIVSEKGINVFANVCQKCLDGVGKYAIIKGYTLEEIETPLDECEEGR